MPEPMKPLELEKAVKEVSAVPEPDAEFVNSLRARFVAEGHASAIKHQEIQMKNRILKKRLVWAMAAIVLVALVLVSTSPTVVNALKRLFGYVPNVGIIDQSTQVFVLAEPVTMTRDGFIVTVDQAVLNGEKTAVVYSYILPPDYVFPENSISTTREPYLTLPDGTRLDVVIARHVGSSDCPECYIRYLMEFPPLPAGVNEITLEIPDLIAIADNTAPQDWKFQLKFKPADPSEIAPVIEQIVTSIPATASAGEPTQLANSYGITNSLDKFVAVPDGYILYGNTSWTDPSIPPYGVSTELAFIKDANGVDVPFDYEDPGMNSEPGELRYYWAYKIGSNFKPPLTFSFVLLATVPADGGSFTFEPGPNPQIGQRWNIAQDVTVNNETIHVLFAEQGGIEPGIFLFTMQSDSNIVGASVIDLDHPPLGGGGGGGGIPTIGVPFMSSFGYQMPMPQGPLTLTFTNVQLLLPGDWSLTWSP
ncbi:MAG: hypothetical protein U0X92_14950 [Anaerolineales bacterium]